MKKAVILLSGGLDSTTALYLAKSKEFELYAISFKYGQKHEKELEACKKVAEALKVKEHKIVELNIGSWGGSSLTDSSMAVPEHNTESKDIPSTYVPARNMIFLSVAASYAEAIGAQDIFIGVSQVDYSGYVDCREEFISAMQKAINKGTVCGAEENKPITINAPFMYMKKEDEIKLGLSLGVDYSLTWSCYNGREKACGVCDSCKLRLAAFEKAGAKDPIEYE